MKDLAEEISWIESRKEEMLAFWSLVENGTIPTRVTHNDTKISNILFDAEGEVLCVIDLDTCMSSTSLNDFGDAIRFAANFVEEDCPEYDKVGVDLDVFRAFSEGFLAKTAKTLTPNEVDTLALSCFCLTAELAVRFLDDYIQGDPYFKINAPDHNLVRTRCQIALAKDLLAKMPEMDKIVRDCIAAAM